MALTNVNISPDDQLPDQICSPCLSELATAVCFKTKCEDSDLQLHKNVSQKTDIKDESEEHEDNQDFQSSWEGENDYVAENIKEEIYLNDADIKNKVETHEDQQYLEIPLDKHDHVVEKGESLELDVECAKKEKSDGNHFDCDHCGQIFNTKCKVRVHLKRTHKPHLICESCRRVFKTFRTYHKHKKMRSKGCTVINKEGVRVEGEGKSRVFHCSYCDYKSKLMSDIRAHAVIHTGVRPFACNLCPNTYTQSSSLIDHKEAAHGEYRVQITCNYCGILVRGRNKAYKHLAQHTATFKYQCDLCARSFKSKISLVYHLDRHEGVKKQICDLCSDAFYTPQQLMNHKQRKHTEHDPYIKCKFCDFKAKTKKIVVVHERKHNGKNFVCSKARCGMFFLSEHAFRMHEKAHIDGKIHNCSLCNDRFKRKVYLVTHMKRKHNGDH